jgi:membrane-bound metal-dependent hydrolase YbcI (DUF457 family)
MMRGHTHALFGVTTLVAVNALTGFVQPHGVQGVSTGMAICASAAILGALAPDVDAEDSAIQRDLGIAGSLASQGLRSMGVGHRGLTHYGVTMLVVIAVSYVVGGWLGFPDAGLAFGLGYFSHVAIADAMTRYGVPLWAPLSATRFHLLPRAFRVKTGGPVEALVSLLVGLILAWLGWGMVSMGLLKKLF